MKILVEAYLEKNFGDDLFLKILFERYKSDQFVIWVNDEDYINIFKEYKNVKVKVRNLQSKLMYRFNSYNKMFINKFINDYDVLLFIGGSIFIEGENWETIYNYRSILVNAFKNQGKDICIVGANFGPYNNDKFYNEYRKLFSKCKDVCFREEYSINLFNDITNVRVAPDIVFQLSSDNSKDKKKGIGISIIDLEWRQGLMEFEKCYVKKMRDLVLRFVEDEKKVYLLSFCKAEGDEKAIKKILDSISDEKKGSIEVIRYNGDMDSFLMRISRFEMLVGCRFHSIIVSQVFEQGVYPIIYSNKTLNMLEDIGLSEYYTYIQDIDLLDICNVSRVSFNNKVNLAKISRDSEKQFLVLDEILNSKRG